MRNVIFLIKNKSKSKRTKFVYEVFLFIQYFSESMIRNLSNLLNLLKKKEGKDSIKNGFSIYKFLP